MAGSQYEMTVGINANMNIGNVLTGVKQLQGAFSALKLPANLTANVYKEFDKLNKQLKDFQDLQNKSNLGKSDLKALDKLRNSIDSTYGHLIEELNQLSSKKIILDADATKIKEAEQVVRDLQQQIQDKLNKVDLNFNLNKNKTIDIGLNSFVKQLESASGRSKQFKASLEEINQAMASGNTSNLGAQILNAINQAQKLKGAGSEVLRVFSQMGIIKLDVKKLDDAKYRAEKFADALKIISPELQKLNIDVSTLKDKLATAFEVRNDAFTTGIRNGQQAIEKTTSALESNRNAARETGEAYKGFAQQTVSATEQVQQLQQSTQYFFSLRNMINLLKRGVDEAIQSVKELDAAMTETAVVTDYKVSDLWGMLPQYAQLANQLGATTQGAYETMTLYFQQGLDQTQAFELGAETMKMARIAGLDYAETTDMMTAALRGFNMELNETSAKRVNDVYSELAAITASDTEELGTAMQRTASIAHSAGASFEGATAFLAQAIETTREPAENIGTAMKTIIARFQEMKKNPLEVSEVDGEEVDFNKIDAALKTIGVDLMDANGQFREWDKVMLDISSRWDTLSQSQQRYIATVAAGSRQQSRFIAMVSNYDRTMQLMEAANNSAGASDEQFSKTMDSLESKLNKLHNAWELFTMGIANNDMIKLAVDGLTGFLSVTNKIIDTLSLGIGPVKSFLSIFAAFTGLRIAGHTANKLIGGLGGLIDPKSSFSQGFFGGASGLKQEKDAAQAKIFYQPIVEAIRTQTQALITKDSSGFENNGPIASQQAVGYKDFTKTQSQFRELFNQQKGFTIKDATGQLSKVSAAQQGLILNNSPGMVNRISRGYDNYLKQFNFDKQGYEAGVQIKNNILKGMRAGKISATEFDKILPPLEIANRVGGETGKQMALKVGENLKHYLGSQEANIAKEVEKRIQFARAQETDWTPVTDKERRMTRGAVMKEYADEWLTNGAASQAMGDVAKKTDKVQQSLSGLGTTVSTAGQAFSTFGMILSNLGLEGAGMAFTALGSTITNVGMTITSVASVLPSMIAKVKEAGSVMKAIKLAAAESGIGGALIGTGIAAGVGIALASIVAISKKMKQEAQEAAKEVTETYNSAIDEISKKESDLKNSQVRLDELAKGVDSQGRNLSLTNDEYQEYLSLSRQVADIAPELIRGYDAQGNVIIATGKAIDDLIQKQEKLRKEAIKTYTSTNSIKDIIEGFQASDIYDKVRPTKATAERTFGKQQTNLSTGIQKSGLTLDYVSQSIQGSLGRSLNFSNLSTEDIKWVSDHYADIIRVIESENTHLSETAKAGLEEAFTGVHVDFSDVEAELAPLQDQLQQYLSLEGLDATGLELGAEFTTAFNNGLQDIALDAALTGDYANVKNRASTFAKEFQKLTGEGSKYREEINKVKKAEEDYISNIEDVNALKKYQNALQTSATEIENFAKQELSAGRITVDFYNMLLDGANNIRQSATEPVISLSEAINTLSDELTNAKGAYDRFSEATENNNYSTASDSMSKIFEEALDDKHTAGYGDNVFWTGARELLDKNTLNQGHNSVQKWMKENQAMFAEGADGYNAFVNRVRGLSQESRDELESMGVVWDKTSGMFSKIPETAFSRFAELLHLNDDAFAALLSKAQQWAHLDFSNINQMKAALSQDERAVKGQSGNYYMREQDVTTEIRNAHPDWNDDKVIEQINQWKKEGIVTLPSPETLTEDKEARKELKTSLKDLGIKDQSDLVKILGETGVYGKEELKAYAEQLEGKNFDENQFNDDWKTSVEKIKNPQLAEGNATLKQIESYVSVLAGRALQERIRSGDAQSSDFDYLNKVHDAVYGQAGEYDTLFQKFGLGLNKDGQRLSEQEYVETSSQISSAMSELEQIIDAAGEGYRNAADKYGENSEQAKKYADELSTAQRTYQSLQAYQSNANNYVAENGYRTDRAAANAGNIEVLANGLVQALTSTGIAPVTDWFKKRNADADSSQQSEEEFHESHPAGYVGAAFLKEWQWVQDFFSDFSLPDFNPDSINQLKTSGEAINEAITNTSDGITSSGEILGQALSSMSLKTQEGVDEAEQSITNQDSRLNKIDVSWLQKFMSSAVDKVNKIISQPPGGTTTTPVSNTINKGAGAVAAIAKNVTNNAQDNTSVMSVDVTGIEKFDEAKTKATDAKNVIEAGATFQVSVSDSGLASVAKQAATINKASGNKNINVTATASGLEDTQSLTTAVGDFKKLKNDSVKLTVKVSGLPDLTSAISKVHSFYNLRDDKVTLTTKHENKATGTHNHGYVSAPPKAGSAARGSYGQLGPKGKGGMTLTGELGYEIAWIPSENRSMILGANGPQMVNLPGDAIVWTHEQSKKIMKQKSIPAGSHAGEDNSVSASGWITPGGNSGGSKGNNNINTKAAKQSLKAANTGEKAAKKAGKVSVYWENLAHKNEALQRKMDKNQKLFEKLLKAGGTTQASIAGAADEYKKSLNQIISLNQGAMNTAQSELNRLDSGTKVKVSYKSGKKTKTKKINTKKYIDTDPTTGAYVINQAAISKKAGKNKELAKAIKAEAEKQIKDYQDKYNSAEDAVAKATEALDQLADDMYTTFHQWEKTITQVYLLGQRLEQLTKQRDVYEAAFDSEIDRLSAHFGNAEDSLPRIRSALNQSRELLVSQLDAQSKLIQGTYDEYANALDLTAYRKKTIDANPESQEAKGDYAVREATLQFLSKIGITDMDKFDYSDAVQQLEARGYNEKSYNQIKEGLDDIKSIQDGYYSSIEDTYKKASEIYGLMNEYQSFISEFEGNLLDGIAEQTEAEINRLDKLNTALAKAMKELLDEVKRKLDERRQKEDNQKTESDISKKQQRLTALRADTSGGHATEIAQLEKEIAEARQNYGRTLEDQLIEKLQNQADIAEKQRERQIELLEGQKELAEKTGTNLEQVRKWLQDPRANYEQIREAYFANAKYDEATPGKQKEIEGQFEADFAKYMGYSEQLKALQTIDEHVKAILDRADEQAGVEHIDREKTQKELVSVNEKLTKEQETKESLQKDLGEAQSNLDSLEQQRLEASKQLASVKEREKETQKAYGAAQNQYQAALQSGDENQIAAAKANVQKARTDHEKAKRKTEEAQANVTQIDTSIAKAKANVDNIKNKIAETDANINNLKQQKTELEGLLNTQDGIKEPDIKFQEATAPTAAPTQANTASQDLANMYQMAIRNFPFDMIGVGGGNGFMREKGYDELLRLAQKLGYNERQVLSDLVNLHHGNWEPILNGFARARMSNKINLERLVATFPSPALQKALNDRNIISAYKDRFEHLRPLPGMDSGKYQDGQIISMNGQRMTPYDYLLALVQRYHITPYKTGGIADFTGPAWLDGTPSKPELVLNATDTKNFIALKDVLSRAMSSVGHVENSYGGNANFEININVDHISNDYDVNKVVDQVEKRIVQKSGYRNVTQVRNFR